jgi:hypothetical protein
MRARDLLLVTVGAITLAGAFVLGRETAPPRQVTERIVERVALPAAGPRPGQPSMDEVRAAVHQALAEREVRPCEPAADPEPAARDGQAFAAARAALAEAMGDGVWTEDDRERVISRMTPLSAPEAAEIMETLMPALGSGALKLATDGPPI